MDPEEKELLLFDLQYSNGDSTSDGGSPEQGDGSLSRQGQTGAGGDGSLGGAPKPSIGPGASP